MSRREDLFGADFVSPGDGLGANQPAVGFERVPGHTSCGASTGGDGLPLDLERSAFEPADTALNSTSDDPLDIEPVDLFGRADHHGARVLEAGRINTIDEVGPGEPVAVDVGGEVSGKSTAVEAEEQQGSDDAPGGVPADHAADLTFRIPNWMRAAIAGMLVLIAAAIAFAVFEPVQVLPRIRLAPGYSLETADGGGVTSESVRGSVTLYSFVNEDCDAACRDGQATVRTVSERVANEIDLADVAFRLVTIVVDPELPADRLATIASDLDVDSAASEWTVANGSQDELKRTISTGFERWYDGDAAIARTDPGFVLVDGNGVIRGDYRYQTLADDSDKLVRHIDLLAAEIRHSSGAASVAYEAAHLFLCYP